MLFSKIYNLIKYKNFPSSFLFRNRLYIERDSKHRRITNNIGLTFRNSKWTNYENNNIRFFFIKSYINFFIYLFILFFIIYCIFIILFSNNIWINQFFFFFWSSTDLLEYYVSFFLWSIYSFFVFFFNKIYFNVIHYKILNYSPIYKEIIFLKKNKIYNRNKNLNLSENDINWLFVSWINSEILFFDKNKLNFKNLDFIFENLIESKTLDLYYINTSFFFQELYKSIFFINSNFKFFSFLQNLPLSSFLQINFFFNFSNFQFIWSLDSFFLENLNFFFLKNKRGTFFLSEKANIKNINQFFFISSLNSKILFSKWNRWLYRYSLLHRKSIKFSQKFTFFKKLLSSNFYNSSFFKKNIWNSNYFNKNSRKSFQMTNFFDFYFSDLYKTSINSSINRFQFLTFFSKNHTLLNNFSFFENSYLWHIKRFFTFNSLNNNNYTFFFEKNKNIYPLISLKNLEITENFFYYNFFLKKKNLFFKNTNILNNNTDIDFTNEYFFSLKSSKDYSFFFNDIDFFSQSNLNSFRYLTSSSNFSFDEFYFDLQNNISFFNPTKKDLKKKNNFFFLNQFFFKKNNLEILWLYNFLIKK